MGVEIEELRTRFLKGYASVPEALRNDIVALVEERPYSWNAAFLEVNGKTPLGDRILRKLEEIGLFKD
jgi:hypothetical protein